MTTLRPRTTWEHCVSMADLLLQWAAQDDPTLASELERTQATVLLAAVLYDRTHQAGLEGPAIMRLPLADVADGLQYVVSALQACPAPADTGGRERDDLLARYGDADVAMLLGGVRRAVQRHREDAGADETLLADRLAALCERIPALQATARRQQETLTSTLRSPQAGRPSQPERSAAMTRRHVPLTTSSGNGAGKSHGSSRRALSFSAH